MALGILCTIMLSPFPLLVPIGIGVIRIISNAVKREKEAPPVPPPIVYYNGARERRAVNSVKEITKLKNPRMGKGETEHSDMICRQAG